MLQYHPLWSLSWPLKAERWHACFQCSEKQGSPTCYFQEEVFGRPGTLNLCLQCHPYNRDPVLIPLLSLQCPLCSAAVKIRQGPRIPTAGYYSQECEGPLELRLTFPPSAFQAGTNHKCMVGDDVRYPGEHGCLCRGVQAATSWRVQPRSREANMMA